MKLLINLYSFNKKILFLLFFVFVFIRCGKDANRKNLDLAKEMNKQLRKYYSGICFNKNYNNQFLNHIRQQNISDNEINSQLSDDSTIMSCTFLNFDNNFPSINNQDQDPNQFKYKLLKTFLKKIKSTSWNCNKCSFQNSRDNLTCEICSSRKNELSSWNCKNCTFENSNEKLQCEICSSRKNELSSWNCNDCTFENSNEKLQCEICGSQNKISSNKKKNDNSDEKMNDDKNNSNSWNCKQCTYENNNKSLICDMCNSEKEEHKNVNKNSIIKPPLSENKDWKCEYCFLENIGKQQFFCSNCLEAKSGYWKCCKCNLIYKNDEDCGQCKISRFDSMLQNQKIWKEKAIKRQRLILQNSYNLNDNNNNISQNRIRNRRNDLVINNNQNDLVINNNQNDLVINNNQNDWRCKNCKEYNRPSFEKCAMCGKHKQKDPSNGSIINNNQNDWKCKNCKEYNRPSFEKCAMCGKHKQKDPSNSSIINNNQNDWKCKNCKEYNRPTFEKCAMCGEHKQKDTSNDSIINNNQNDWRCIFCKKDNKPASEKCFNCKTYKPEKRKKKSPLKDPKKENILLNCNNIIVPYVPYIKEYNKQKDKWICINCSTNNTDNKICNDNVCNFTKHRCIDPDILKEFTGLLFCKNCNTRFEEYKKSCPNPNCHDLIKQTREFTNKKSEYKKIVKKNKKSYTKKLLEYFKEKESTRNDDKWLCFKCNIFIDKEENCTSCETNFDENEELKKEHEDFYICGRDGCELKIPPSKGWCRCGYNVKKNVKKNINKPIKPKENIIQLDDNVEEEKSSDYVRPPMEKETFGCHLCHLDNPVTLNEKCKCNVQREIPVSFNKYDIKNHPFLEEEEKAIDPENTWQCVNCDYGNIKSKDNICQNCGNTISVDNKKLINNFDEFLINLQKITTKVLYNDFFNILKKLNFYIKPKEFTKEEFAMCYDTNEQKEINDKIQEWGMDWEDFVEEIKLLCEGGDSAICNDELSQTIIQKYKQNFLQSPSNFLELCKDFKSLHNSKIFNQLKSKNSEDIVLKLFYNDILNLIWGVDFRLNCSVPYLKYENSKLQCVFCSVVNKSLLIENNNKLGDISNCSLCPCLPKC